MHLRRPRLRIEPVRSYPKPGYPTIDLFARHPERLLQHAPPSWLAGGLTLSAHTAFVLAGGATRGQPTDTAAAATDGTDTGAREEPRPPNQAPDEGVSVAPVFVHGEGLGSVGCVAISPPVFLSESEALEVIWEELRREDLGFDTRPKAVPGLRIETNAPSDPNLARLWEVSGKRPESRALFFDAYSRRYRCGVLFVGHANYEEVAGGPVFFSTAMTYDTLGMAQKVAERLADHGRVHAAVFYDPLVSPNWSARGDFAAERSRATAEAAELLRAQVREFVDWLKSNLRERPRPEGVTPQP